ncbi:DnaJ domain-containing protein [Sneathia sanguinegens]|jgi:hypothetical protein|uniref:DnaJ domain-containing protein n=1 Tax=Sneathia sanguinegens TaxID=40543 RepID=UPI0023F679DB|nr:DnaJ domain-containing protein [Sneathia sanguinegens]
MSFFLIIPFILLILFIVLISIVPYWVYFLLAIFSAISTGKIFNIWTIIYFIMGVWLYSRRNVYHKTFYYRTNYDFDDNFSFNTVNKTENEYEKACEYFGFSPDTPYEQKKKIYREFAKKYHPDINKDPGAEEKFKEINNYWDIIEKYA